MAKIYRLEKRGEQVYPQTIGEAVAVNGKLLSSTLARIHADIEALQQRLSDIENGVVIIDSPTTTTTEAPAT